MHAAKYVGRFVSGPGEVQLYVDLTLRSNLTHSLMLFGQCLGRDCIGDALTSAVSICSRWTPSILFSTLPELQKGNNADTYWDTRVCEEFRWYSWR